MTSSTRPCISAAWASAVGLSALGEVCAAGRTSNERGSGCGADQQGHRQTRRTRSRPGRQRGSPTHGSDRVHEVREIVVRLADDPTRRHGHGDQRDPDQQDQPLEHPLVERSGTAGRERQQDAKSDAGRELDRFPPARVAQPERTGEKSGELPGRETQAVVTGRASPSTSARTAQGRRDCAPPRPDRRVPATRRPARPPPQSRAGSGRFAMPVGLDRKRQSTLAATTISEAARAVPTWV